MISMMGFGAIVLPSPQADSCHIPSNLDQEKNLHLLQLARGCGAIVLPPPQAVCQGQAMLTVMGQHMADTIPSCVRWVM